MEVFLLLHTHPSINTSTHPHSARGLSFFGFPKWRKRERERGERGSSYDGIYGYIIDGFEGHNKALLSLFSLSNPSNWVHMSSDLHSASGV